MLFRIYTEDKNREQTLKLVASQFKSFTVLTGTGYYEGKQEACLVIEIYTTSPSAGRVIALLCHDLKKQNVQESVLLTSHEAKTSFI